MPVHQQLVERLFSRNDNRSQKFDEREVDIVRIGQYRSMGSTAVGREVATGREIRRPVKRLSAAHDTKCTWPRRGNPLQERTISIWRVGGQGVRVGPATGKGTASLKVGLGVAKRAAAPTAGLRVAKRVSDDE